MKKLMFVFSLLIFGAFSVSAQSCSKGKKAACCKSKAKTAATAVKADATDTAVASAYMEAAEAAATADENIMKRVCDKTGSVGYYEKNVCSKSGKVSYNEVNYSDDLKAFVNVSPSEVQSAMMEGSVINVSGNTDTPAPKAKKACCKGKKACDKKTDSKS